MTSFFFFDDVSHLFYKQIIISWSNNNDNDKP